MERVELTLRSNKVQAIKIDDRQQIELDSFVLLTKTKGEMFGHMLCFGSAEQIGTMLVNFFRYCVRMDPPAALTLEAAAKDIIDIAAASRGRGLDSVDFTKTETIN